MSEFGKTGPRHSWAFGCALGMAAMALAACGATSSSTPAQTGRSTPTTSLRVRPTATTTSGSVPSGQAAVLDAWRSAEQTLYGYLQTPWQQDRAKLVAGQAPATLWPGLANYFADPALASEQLFLIGVKMGQLDGPTSFDLGSPKVSTLAPTTATVTGCIYDTGTTTVAGGPGPVTLGGGAGSFSGTWSVELIGSMWKIVAYHSATVSKC